MNAGYVYSPVAARLRKMDKKKRRETPQVGQEAEEITQDLSVILKVIIMQQSSNCTPALFVVFLLEAVPLQFSIKEMSSTLIHFKLYQKTWFSKLSRKDVDHKRLTLIFTYFGFIICSWIIYSLAIMSFFIYRIEMTEKFLQNKVSKSANYLYYYYAYSRFKSFISITSLYASFLLDRRF